MIARLFAVLALAAASAFAAPYPDGSVTRTYRGEIRGDVMGIPQTAMAEAEVTELSFSNGVTVLRVRGRFTDAPLLALGLGGKWSNFIDVYATGFPFRADASWEDGTGRVFAMPSADWSTIELEATGSVVGLTAEISRTTVALVSATTNAPDAVEEAGIEQPGDDIVLTSWTRYGQHKINLPAMRVTRQLFSAKNLGENVRLSFEPLNWSVKPGDKLTDGGVVILWREGDGFAGGLFDWHGVGQTTKTQDNIREGYLEKHRPPAGAEVWYCIVAYGFGERTTIKSGGTW